MSSSPERRLGKRDGLRYAIAWLHRRAETMNDPHAKAVLNSGAFDLGNEIREGHIPPIPDAQDTEDSMPSKRMVPAQQLSDAGEDLVRLAAAKDAETAALKAELDAATATFDDEQAAHQDTLRLWQQAKEEIAALTAQRDRWKADCKDITTCLNNERQKFMELLKGLTEQRDRAMKVVEAARAYREAETDGTPRLYRGKALQDLGNTLDDTLAALDTEAAAETAPSLPETP